MEVCYLVHIMESNDGIKHGVEVIQQVDHLHTHGFSETLRNEMHKNKFKQFVPRWARSEQK